MLELEQSQLQLKRENIVNRLEERYQSIFSALRSEFNQTAASGEIAAEMTIEELRDTK